MSEPKVIVNIDDHPIRVIQHCGTSSVVNITDKGTGVTQAIQNNPQLNIRVGVRPLVSIKYGISHQYDPAGILALVLNGITRDHLDSTLITELDGFNSDLVNLVNQTNLISADLDVAEASLAVAEDEIIANVLAIAATDGQLNIAVSNITQNADSIVSAVTRISNSEGNISAAQSTIIQQANSISQLVTDLASSDTLITQNATAITVQATILNQTNNTLDQATLDITAQGVTIGVISTDLDNAELTIGSTLEMLASQYAVTIQQDGIGGSVVTGLKLILYPDWDDNTISYIIDDYVWFQNSSWKCILAHDSDATNYPQAGAPGSTYWVEEAEGIHTSFSVLADVFKVQSQAGDEVITPFIVNGTSGEVEFNADVKFTGIGTTLISGGFINTNLVNANSIKALSITASEIASDTITSTQIAADTITASEIAADTITTNQISADAIETVNIKAANITTEKINGNAVTVSSAYYLVTSEPITSVTPEILGSISLTVDGFTPIFLFFSAMATGGALIFSLYRNTTELVSVNVESPSTSAFSFSEIPPSGTYTYYFKAGKRSSGESTGYVSRRSLFGIGAKR